MSSTLQRLVGRATGKASGQASASLRPRRPGRFEIGLGSSLHEIHLERTVPATPSLPAEDEPDADARLRANRDRAPARAPTHAPPRSTAHETHVGREEAAAPRPAAGRARLPESVGEALINEPSPTRAPQLPAMHAALTQPARREAAADSLAGLVPAKDVPPHRDGPDAGETRRAESARPGGDRRGPPEPLLPHGAEAALAETLAAALTRPPAGPAPAAQTEADDAGAPEITIRIGRLDIRAEPPRPATRTRETRARSLPPLSEYLRGGRS